MPHPLTLLPLPLLLATTPAHAATWHPITSTVTYPVTGTTGLALYQSIGARGPTISGRHVIAHTRFDLTWTRRYRSQPGGACVLAEAVPHLTVTTTLPQAPAGLSAGVAESWGRFRAGVVAHERVHGRAIVAMVKRIEAFSTGLSAPADPGCRKVRAKLQAYLAKTIAAHRRQSAVFDKAEWGEDGAMRRLALELVNGP